MCGIAGYVDKQHKVDKSKFEQMVDMIEYRGPDDRGTWYGEGVSLGHRRLSIIDVSQDGHQPFEYQDRFVVVYNGEIYNYIEIKDQLIQLGYSFRTKTDTEVLVAAYREYGEKCLSLFNGMWAFAIFDKEKGELFCARDRFGVKPFYYSDTEEGFILASEIKQILFMTGKKPKANRKKLKEFLIHGTSDTDKETMFDGIFHLLPGEYGVYSCKRLAFRKEKYYDISVVANNMRNTKYTDVCDQFFRLYCDSVTIRHRADVKLGYCLSGGLDSSANVCVSHKLFSDSKQYTISSCSEYREYDEQEYADEVVKHTGCDIHKIFPDSKALLGELDDLIWHMDEPFASTSIYASRCVFRDAREQGLTVMLDGQGADELLAGYTDAYPILFRHLFARGRLVRLKKEINAFKLHRLKAEKNVSLTDMVTKPIIKRMLPGKLSQVIRKRKWTKSELSGIIPDASDIAIERKLPIGNKEYIINQMTNLRMLLRFEDRNTMTFSIESRLPFLDYRLVEQLCSIPVTYKIRSGMTKAVMRDALKGILPEKVRQRISKLGFVTAEDKWIMEEQLTFDEEFRHSCERLSPLICVDKAISWWERQNGCINSGDHMVWRFICAAHWADVFEVDI